MGSCIMKTLHLTDEDKFYLGLILAGHAVLLLGFLYCVSRVWLHAMWSSLFTKLHSFLRFDQVCIRKRISPTPADHLVKLPEELAIQHGASFSWRFSPGSEIFWTDSNTNRSNSLNQQHLLAPPPQHLRRSQ